MKGRKLSAENKWREAFNVWKEIIVIERRVFGDWYDPKIEALVPTTIQPVGFEWREAEAFFRARLHELNVTIGGNQ